MKLTARILALVMATLMLVGAAVACGKTEEPAATTTAADQGGAADATTAATEATTESPYDENGYL